MAARFRWEDRGTGEKGSVAWADYHRVALNMGRPRVDGMGGILFYRQKVPRGRNRVPQRDRMAGECVGRGYRQLEGD